MPVKITYEALHRVWPDCFDVIRTEQKVFLNCQQALRVLQRWNNNHNWKYVLTTCEPSNEELCEDAKHYPELAGGYLE